MPRKPFLTSWKRFYIVWWATCGVLMLGIPTVVFIVYVIWFDNPTGATPGG